MNTELRQTGSNGSPAGCGQVELIEKQIAQNAPALADLNNSQLEQVAKMVLMERYKNAMNKEVDLLQTDYTKEKETFLSHAGRTNSKATRQAYSRALVTLEQFATSRKLKTPLALTPATADDWIYSLQADGKAPATVRLYCGAVSSFYTYVSRRTNGTVQNPFRGTKARPKPTAKKQNKFYSAGIVDASRLKRIAGDIKTILGSVKNDDFKAIIACMAYRGLRCGAFERMTIHSDTFTTVTKGEPMTGKLPAKCIDAINNANLKHNAPFSNWTADRVKNLFKYYTSRLYKAGKIDYPYSCHDMRHYYAITQYLIDRDLYRVSKLLNHAGIGITEHYLRGLNVIQ